LEKSSEISQCKLVPVKFVVAITFSPVADVDASMMGLRAFLGESDIATDVFDFDHTRYYHKEMGPGLQKQFISFTQLHDRDQLVLLKLKCMEIEHSGMCQRSRSVNLDPAYMEMPKLVVASHKNFAHRIHIAEGIFGDVQLVYRGGRFVSNEWTYADYKRPDVLDFFRQVRASYATALEAMA